jgi:hypothetical protein
MSKDNSNIVEFVAALRLRQQLVEQAGTAVSDNMMKSILINGMLDQFKPMILFLDQQANIAFDIASQKLIDFASTEGLMTTCKTNKSDGRNNTFSVHDVTSVKTPRMSREEKSAAKDAKEIRQLASALALNDKAAGGGTKPDEKPRRPPKLDPATGKPFLVTYDVNGKVECRKFRTTQTCDYTNCRFSHVLNGAIVNLVNHHAAESDSECENHVFFGSSGPPLQHILPPCNYPTDRRAMVPADTSCPPPPCNGRALVENGGAPPVYPEYAELFTLDEVAGTKAGNFEVPAAPRSLQWVESSSDEPRKPGWLLNILFYAFLTLVLSVLFCHYEPTSVPNNMIGPIGVAVPAWFDPAYWFEAAIKSSSTSTVTSFGFSAIGMTSTVVLAANHI